MRPKHTTTWQGPCFRGMDCPTRLEPPATAPEFQHLGRTTPAPWNVPNTPCMPYMPTLTPLAPPQLIGIHGSPMECLGRFHQVVVISSANIGSHQNPQTSDWKNTQVGGSSLHHPAWRFHCLVGMAQPSKEKQPSRLVGKLSQERSDD